MARARFGGFGGGVAGPAYGGSVGGIDTTVGGAQRSGAATPRTKMAYTQDGQAVEIDSSIPTTSFDPNVGYAGTHYFNAPPPPRQPAPSLYQTAQTANMTPSVQSLVGGPVVAQPAYEQQAQTQLEARLAQEAAASGVAAEKELAEQAAQRGSAQLRERASLNDATFEKRLAALSAVGRPTAGPTTAAPAFNEEAARAAAFGRAKDQAGKTALASLRALQEVMAGRGLRGSSVESSATADIIGGAGSEINDFTGGQLMLDLNRAAEVADREASAGLTRRGQDLGYMQSLLGLMSASGSLY